MNITGSDLVVKSLKDHGIDTLFGIAGDHILHLLDVMYDSNFKMIDFRHESGAVHAADSYSRILRRPAVTLSTTPGHANTIPALANAVHSEAPIINISGSADSLNLGRGAMQEFDQVGVAKAVTKGAWQVPSPERIPEYISLAFRTALNGRQGPVHLTIPHDFQSAEVDEKQLKKSSPKLHKSVVCSCCSIKKPSAAGIFNIFRSEGAAKGLVKANQNSAVAITSELTLLVVKIQFNTK